MAHMNDNDRKRIEFLASSGFTVQEIALQYDISLESVKSHIKVVLEKLNASSRTEAASIAQRKNLLRQT